ncbi:MAG: TIGR03960 family B12-binding radical SAM protein [Armatimonadota bacterium]
MNDCGFDVVLSRVVKPARYTDGEWNAVHKDPRSVRARAALIYPDVYEVGMSHLGLQILYHVLNSHPDFLAERAFAPWPDMESELRSRALPLTSLESQTPLREFDLVGITLPYELTYTNVLNVLDLGGVPVRAADRRDDDPIVVGGGPGAVNPEPMAEFFDAILIGEGEEAIIEIAEAAAEPNRAEALDRLAQVPGVYVPSRYEAVFDGVGPRGAVVPRDRPGQGCPSHIERRIVDDLDAAPFPTRQIVPFLDTVHSRVTLEIMRGCARGCRFCQAGATYRPRRMRSVQTLLRQAEEAVAATGYDEISLLAFTSVDHRQIKELAAKLVERFGPRGIGVALPSLRADAFSVELANTIQRVRKTGLTFAPEAASDRLRRVIRKDLTEDDLFAAAQAAFASGWTRLKLYFMVGLPTETDADVAAVGELVHRLAAFARSSLGGKQGRLQLGVSVGAFVPKPHTPFQWMPQEPMDGLVQKLGILQQSLRGRHVKLSWTEPATSALEAAIARGDRRVGAVIEAAWRAGARFDSWGEHFDPSRWQQAFERQGLRLEDYVNASLDYGDRLAWDHVSCGVEKEALRAEAESALGPGDHQP